MKNDKKPVTDTAEIETIAHQLVTQFLFHEGIVFDSHECRISALCQIKEALSNYTLWFSHLALPEDYPKAPSDAARERITQIIARNFLDENKTIQ